MEPCGQHPVLFRNQSEQFAGSITLIGEEHHQGLLPADGVARQIGDRVQGRKLDSVFV